jgi:hypothetical protein
MLWAIASSVFVIYLYRQLNAESASPSRNVPADTLEAELAALNAQIATLESKIGSVSTGDAKP